MKYRLQSAFEAAAGMITYIPVQRQNPHGGQMTPDTVAGMPVPIWEELVAAFEEELFEDEQAAYEAREH